MGGGGGSIYMFIILLLICRCHHWSLLHSYSVHSKFLEHDRALKGSCTAKFANSHRITISFPRYAKCTQLIVCKNRGEMPGRFYRMHVQSVYREELQSILRHGLAMFVQRLEDEVFTVILSELLFGTKNK